MFMKSLVILFSSLFLLLSLGMNQSVVYFEKNDPRGDDNGYGNFQYPTNKAFEPYKDLFDLTNFKVWTEESKKGYIIFDISFAKVTNPWQAPEGFIHQNIRILVDSVPQVGNINLPSLGANVTVNPEYKWDFCLKIVGWENSKLIITDNNNFQTKDLKVFLLKDNITIRALVPEKEIGKPNSTWNYYVLVGSYDGFGQDYFRKVAPQVTEWAIGGGKVAKIEPNIMDILALENGKYSQKNQLKSFDLNKKKLAELYPVGQELHSNMILDWLYGLLIIAALAGLVWFLIKMSHKVSCFWIDKKNDKKQKE